MSEVTKIATRVSYGNALVELAKEHDDVYVLDADLAAATQTAIFKKEFPETEIIILSGYEEFEYAKEGIKIGVARYLLKPISGDALIKEIDLVAASIEERKQKERIRERYFKQSMDRESEKDNLNIQELDYKQFEKSKLQEFMKVGRKEEVPYFIDEMFEKLDESSKNAEKIAYESKTYFKDAWGRFKQNKLAMVGLIFLAIMIMLCIFVPHFFAIYV